MKAFVVLLMLSIIVFAQGERVLAEPRIALVIGNGAYGASPLTDPLHDVALIGKSLRTLGFDVVNETDVGQNEMRNLIRHFGNQLKARKDGVGLFYYSGHGMQVGGRNYMIPVGATIQDEGDVEIYGVGVDDVLTRMRVAGNVMNFVFLDACRDNPFEKSFKSVAKGLSRMDAPKGTLIAFAAQPSKVALQGPGDYSYFTEALAREVVKPGISVRDMLLNVRVTVHDKTNGRQVPVVEDQLLAKFYFQYAPGQHVVVNSKITRFILLNSPTYKPGEHLILKISTNSSKVRAFGLFESRPGRVERVQAKFNKRYGGVYISYKIPVDATAGIHEVEVYIQEIGTANEERHNLNYEILKMSK